MKMGDTMLNLYVLDAVSSKKVPAEIDPASKEDFAATHDWQTNWESTYARQLPNKVALHREDNYELLGLMSYELDERGQRIADGRGGWKNHREDTTDWNNKEQAEVWRSAWADYTNQALEAAGKLERIDHRSYQRQGVQKIPSVHLGVAAKQMEKRGIVTRKGDLNRQITADNKLLKEIKARIARLHRIAASHKLTQELRITIVPYGGYHSAYASLYAGRTHAIALSYRRVHLGSYVIQKILVLHRHYYGAYQILITGIFRCSANFHQFTFNEIRYLHGSSSFVLLRSLLFYILPK